MARRGNSLSKGFLSIDFNGFEEYAEKLDNMGASLESVFTEIMETIGAEVQEDSRDALADANLPAKGKYSRPQTINTLVDAKAEVSGSVISVPVGFDKTKVGAGGWLITGTPKMQPDAKLAAIYDSKSYVTRKNKEIKKMFESEIAKRMK